MKPSKRFIMGIAIAIAALLSNALANWHDGKGPVIRSNPPRHSPMTSPSTVASRDMVTVPAGTKLAVRLVKPISSEGNQLGEGFTAELYGPLIVDRNYLAGSRSEILGQIERQKASGRFVEPGNRAMVLRKLIVDGYEYDLETEPVPLVTQESAKHAGEDSHARKGADEPVRTILGRDLETHRPSTATQDRALANRAEPQLTFTLSIPAELPVIRRMGTTSPKAYLRSPELHSEFRKADKSPTQEQE